MKKITAIVLSLILVSTSTVFLASCNKNETVTDTTTANKTTENSVVENQSELEKLRQKYAIDDTYRENVNKNPDGYSEYCYEKVDKNGIVNPYDALKVTIDSNTGEILASKHFDKSAFIEAKINKKIAEDKATATHSNSTVNLCELEYYMPDYPNGNILLAYKVAFKDGKTVYVNAVNGDIVGSDQIK